MSMSKNDLDRAFDACRAELQATKDRANVLKDQLDRVARERVGVDLARIRYATADQCRLGEDRGGQCHAARSNTKGANGF